MFEIMFGVVSMATNNKIIILISPKRDIWQPNLELLIPQPSRPWAGFEESEIIEKSFLITWHKLAVKIFKIVNIMVVQHCLQLNFLQLN